MLLPLTSLPGCGELLPKTPQSSPGGRAMALLAPARHHHNYFSTNRSLTGAGELITPKPEAGTTLGT